jgi:DNA-binding XRE family transcriptional regulator
MTTNSLFLHSPRREAFRDVKQVPTNNPSKPVGAIRQQRNGDGDGPVRDQDWDDSKFIAASFVLDCRTRRKWTQQQLASATGVTPGYIGQIESFRVGVRPPLEFLIKVARVTNTPFKLSMPATGSKSGRHD